MAFLPWGGGLEGSDGNPTNQPANHILSDWKTATYLLF